MKFTRATCCSKTPTALNTKSRSTQSCRSKANAWSSTHRSWTRLNSAAKGRIRARMNQETETFELIRTLTELPGPTGHEDAVQDWIFDRWQHSACDIRRSRVNNILARIGGSGRRLAIMAHADEICFMVKSVTDDGFLHIWPYYQDTRGHPPRWVLPLNQSALVMTSGAPVHRLLRHRQRTRRHESRPGRQMELERLVHRYRRSSKPKAKASALVRAAM